MLKKMMVIGMKCILPFISKCCFKVDIENARKEITVYDTKSQIFKPESLKRNVTFDCMIDLSIIIPVYNAEVNLQKCLNSVIQQKTNYNFEIILVNDGSTDHSTDILTEYQKKCNNIVILEQENSGTGKARNLGINHAKRKVYWFYR